MSAARASNRGRRCLWSFGCDRWAREPPRCGTGRLLPRFNDCWPDGWRLVPFSENSLIWADNLLRRGIDAGLRQRRIDCVHDAFVAIRLESGADSLEFVCSPSADATATFRLGPPFVRHAGARRDGGWRWEHGHDGSVPAATGSCHVGCAALSARGVYHRRSGCAVYSSALHGAGLWKTPL